jgi:hypothetical protein
MIEIIKKILIILIIIVAITFSIIPLDHTHWSGIDRHDDMKFSHKFLNRMYFVSSTLSSVGYGDIHPISTTAKIVTIVLQLVTILGIVTILHNYNLI